MEKMLMQEYIEDYAKFLCLEENEGTLFYFLSIKFLAHQQYSRYDAV
jgi:hypothetical protein